MIYFLWNYFLIAIKPAKKQIKNIPLEGCEIQGRIPSPINGDSLCNTMGILSSIELESVRINSPFAIIPCFNNPFGDTAITIGSPGLMLP